MSARRNASIHPLTIRLDAPLHHGAFESGDTGNAVLFRRMPLAADPAIGIPVVSGNALRGALRRVVMRDLLALCGLRLGALPPIAWDRLYAAVANGGHLESAETRTDPEGQRVIRDAVPALSVFGAALYSWMLAGRVSVGWLWPRCQETVAAGICAPSDNGADMPSAEELITEVTLVRHVDRDQQDPARSGVTPMPVTVEALVPGVELVGSIVQLARLSPAEIGVVGWGLDQLVALGAKSGAGFGRVTIAHDIPRLAYDEWRTDETAVARARVTLAGLVGETVSPTERVA